MARPYRLLTAIALVGLLAGGCGSGSSAVKRVRGKVHLDGRPIGGAQVQFLPPDRKDPQASSFVARTDPDGSFEIKPGPHVQINPGRYGVVITKLPELPGGPNAEDIAVPAGGLPGVASEVPAKYSDPLHPQFQRDITAGDNDLAPFEMVGDKKGR